MIPDTKQRFEILENRVSALESTVNGRTNSPVVAPQTSIKLAPAQAGP